jgi:ATP-dependent Lon protease
LIFINPLPDSAKGDPMPNLLLLPLDDTVLFPGMTATIAIDVGDEERVLVVPRHEDGYASVGTIAEVLESARLPTGGRVATLHGLARGVPGAASTGGDGQLRVDVEEVADSESESDQIAELARTYRAVV